MKRTILLSILLISLASCATEKAYTARNSGIGNRAGSGLGVVSQTQKYYNFESAMKRTNPNKKFLWIFSGK